MILKYLTIFGKYFSKILKYFKLNKSLSILKKFHAISKDKSSIFYRLLKFIPFYSLVISVEFLLWLYCLKINNITIIKKYDYFGYFFVVILLKSNLYILFSIICLLMHCYLVIDYGFFKFFEYLSSDMNDIFVGLKLCSVYRLTLLECLFGMKSKKTIKKLHKISQYLVGLQNKFVTKSDSAKFLKSLKLIDFFLFIVLFAFLLSLILINVFVQYYFIASVRAVSAIEYSTWLMLFGTWESIIVMMSSTFLGGWVPPLCLSSIYLASRFYCLLMKSYDSFLKQNILKVNEDCLKIFPNLQYGQKTFVNMLKHAVYYNQKFVKNTFSYALSLNFIVNIVFILEIFLKKLDLTLKFWMIWILLIQIVSIGVGTFVLINWSETIYKCSQTYLKLYILLSQRSEKNIKKQICLMIFIEKIHTKKCFRFAFGPLSNISRKVII